MSDSYKIQLTSKSKIETIEKLIKSNIDEKDTLLFEECKDCPRYKARGKSCSCMVYRINRGDN